MQWTLNVIFMVIPISSRNFSSQIFYFAARNYFYFHTFSPLGSECKNKMIKKPKCLGFQATQSDIIQKEHTGSQQSYIDTFLITH